jgi:hypothetical protein
VEPARAPVRQEGPRLQNPTIIFHHMPDQAEYIRHWYHVPRVGEMVTLDILEATVSGEVTRVEWSDENVVVVFDD